MFFKWLKKKLQNTDLGDQDVLCDRPVPNSISTGYDSGPKSISFRIVMAKGGYIIQSDRQTQKGYVTEVQVIHENSDFIQEVSDFISVEVMR